MNTQIHLQIDIYLYAYKYHLSVCKVWYIYLHPQTHILRPVCHECWNHREHLYIASLFLDMDNIFKEEGKEEDEEREWKKIIIIRKRYF